MSAPVEKYVFSFNQDQNSLSVGHKKRFKLYNLSHLDEVEPFFDQVTKNEILIIERYCKSSYLMVVYENEPNILHHLYFKKDRLIGFCTYPENILRIRIGKELFAVGLEKAIHIYQLKDSEPLYVIDTIDNFLGLFALSAEKLAYPSDEVGKIHVVLHESPRNIIRTFEAHENQLAAMEISATKEMIVTASTKGTIIRIHSMQGQRLHEFRRGVYIVKIMTLTFSSCEEYVVSTSNTETVHIFKLGEEKTDKDTFSGYLQSWDRYSIGIGHKVSYAAVHSPEADNRTCALTTIEGSLKLLIASSDGYLYVYAVPESKGHFCRLVNKIELFNTKNLVMESESEEDDLVVVRQTKNNSDSD